MAIINTNNLKQYFLTGLKPTQQQFWNLIDSFRHKNDPVPALEVDGLQGLLDQKLDAELYVEGFNVVRVMQVEETTPELVGDGTVAIQFIEDDIVNLLFNAETSKYLIGLSEIINTSPLKLKLFNTTQKKTLIADVSAIATNQGQTKITLDPGALVAEVSEGDVLKFEFDFDKSNTRTSELINDGENGENQYVEFSDITALATDGLQVQDENGLSKFIVDEALRFDSSFFTFQTLSKTLSLKQEGATKVVSERATSNIRTVWMDVRGKRVAYGGSGGIKSASLSTPFNLSTYGNETVLGNGAVKTLEFNQDGTRLVIIESTGSATYSRYRTYELTTPFDLSTANSISTKGLTSVTLEGVATAPKTVSFLLSPDGTKIYQHFNGNILAEATMSTPYDVSTIGDFTTILTFNYSSKNPSDMTFAKNGHELYISMINTNISNNLCYKWFLPAPYDLSVMKQIGWSTNFNTTNIAISASTLYPYFLRKVAGQTANNKLEMVRLNYEF